MGHSHHEHRTLWSRFIRYWIGPIFYHLNLYDKGKPSLTRMMLLGGFVHGLFTLTTVTIRELQTVPIGQVRPTIGATYLAFAALVYSLIFGYRGFHMWMDSKNIGRIADGVVEEETQKPAVIQAEAQLAQFYAQGGKKAPTHGED